VSIHEGAQGSLGNIGVNNEKALRSDWITRW
jgi:hypothetical protein